MRRALLMVTMAAMVVTAPAFSQTPPLTDMVRAERMFAARALVVGWKQAFLEYFADTAVGFDGDQAAPAKRLFLSGVQP